MSANNPDGWPGAMGPGGNPDQHGHGQGQQRPYGAYGPNTGHQHGPSGLSSGPVLPPPPGSFYGPGQQGGHSIASLAGLSQPPAQAPQGHLPPAPHSSGSQPLSSLAQPPPYQLPGAASSLDREREMRQMDLREREARERQRHAEERDREPAEREARDRPLREPHPHHNHAGSIPIHQPVASKVSTTIHGPGGLLSSIAPGTGPNPPDGLGGSGGAGNLFGGPLPPADNAVRSIQPFSTQPPQHQVLPFGSHHAVHSLSGGVTGLAQGQQPILNDALSYLDQVKVQFVDQPDVYNRFLDIMKDFKSQAIDTPGVIERVSTLFAGHPALIQGFNTFLPPGYRIECGTVDDPNAIRVTTPMGTTVSTTAAGLRPSTPANGAMAMNGAPHGGVRQGPYYDRVPRESTGGWQQASQHAPGMSEGMFSPSGRPAPLPAMNAHGGPGQSQAHLGHPEVPSTREQPTPGASAAALAQHQQEQRGVSQLQNAVTVATGTPQGTAAVNQGSPGGGPGPMLAQPSGGLNGAAAAAAAAAAAGLPGGQASIEKRGPVEFNHAISYVNKIKNRFSTQPEIYKQFLEILQTYQRESKPIQDVYAQVTQLFNSAPDLLEDFKQFLPESAAQARAQAAAKQAAGQAAEDAAILSNVRGDSTPLIAGQATPGSQQPAGGHRSEVKMPPVGNFAPPPSASKESKKRRAGAATGAPSGSAATQAALSNAEPGSAGPSGGRAGASTAASTNKRPKLSHPKAPQAEAAPVSPSLVPALPEPLPPTPNAAVGSEETAFFDRVKKYIGNRSNMAEFLKLCNLWTQDLIDKTIFMQKINTYIGGNPELVAWFRRFIQYDQHDAEQTSLKARAPTRKVNLSSCRGYGPSYRLLPRRETLKQCSGRDEMCWSVLNDEWASHPTWASEESGFVAHRKNMYEEALHRIEEERHDYDFNIEASLRTIQLLEPIAKTILRMSDEERANFTLSPGIGGQSTAIYQRVIKKLYGRDKGQQVIEKLYTHPCAVVPVLLARLKVKTEEWQAVQREWEKVWREQAAKMYYKSLDHMGAIAKTADKKQYTSKTLATELHLKYEEQRRDAKQSDGKMHIPRYQLAYLFADLGIVLDASRLLICFAANSNSYNASDRQKLEVFMRAFITAFFGIPLDTYDNTLHHVSGQAQADEEMADADASPGETSTQRSRGAAIGRRTDLLRGVLNRGRGGKVARDGDSAAPSISQATTPDFGSAMEDDAHGALDKDEPAEVPDATSENWLQALGSSFTGKGDVLREIAPNEPFERDTFNLYCGTSIYCFFRLFQVLYERLYQIKRKEPSVAEDVRRAKMQKPAHELKMISKRPEDFFEDTSAGANYYGQLLDMVQDVIEGQMEMTQFEEVMRFFYLHTGWQMYGFEKLFAALARFAAQVVAGDAKDKSHEMLQLFYKDREKVETTHEAEIIYRKHVERLVKEGDVYRIEYNEPLSRCTIQLLKKDDATFDVNMMDPEARWLYYVASYVKVDPTEGVAAEGIATEDRLVMPLLKRNLPSEAQQQQEKHDERKRPLPQAYSETLEMRICVNTYKVVFTPHTTDWFVHSPRHRAGGGAGGGGGDDDDDNDKAAATAAVAVAAVVDPVRSRNIRNARFRDRFVRRLGLDMSEHEKAAAEQSYRDWIDGVDDAPKPDEEMVDV